MAKNGPGTECRFFKLEPQVSIPRTTWPPYITGSHLRALGWEQPPTPFPTKGKKEFLSKNLD